MMSKQLIFWGKLNLQPYFWKPLFDTSSVKFVTTHFIHECFGECQVQNVPKEIAAFHHFR